MSKREDAEYSAWLEDLATALSPEDAERLKAIQQKAPDKFREKFRDGLREGDYYRRLERLNANARELAKKEAEIASMVESTQAEREREMQKALQLQQRLEIAQAQLEALGLTDDDGHGKPTSKREDLNMSDVSKEEMEKLKQQIAAQAAKLEAMDRAFPAVLAESLEVGAEIAKEGWKVSPSEVLKLSLEKQQPPKAILQALTREEREKRAEEKHEKEKAKWMEEGRREVLSRLPSPDQLRPIGPSIVDTIRGTAVDRRDRVSGAIDLYNKDYPGMPVV